MGVDLDGKFAGGDELRYQGPAFADIQLLRAQGSRHLFAFVIAIVVQQCGYVVIGILIHAHLAFPLGLQEIVDAFWCLCAGDLFVVEQVNHEMPTCR